MQENTWGAGSISSKDLSRTRFPVRKTMKEQDNPRIRKHGNSCGRSWERAKVDVCLGARLALLWHHRTFVRYRTDRLCVSGEARFTRLMLWLSFEFGFSAVTQIKLCKLRYSSRLIVYQLQPVANLLSNRKFRF